MRAPERAMLELLAGYTLPDEPCFPTLTDLARVAVARGIVPDEFAGRSLVFLLCDTGAIETFDVDGWGPFYAVAGTRPALEDLPKKGDEIILSTESGSV